MRKTKNLEWHIEKGADGFYHTDHAMLSVLQDIRDELRALNRLLGCPNFVGIPQTLRNIAAHTKKPKRKPKLKIA